MLVCGRLCPAQRDARLQRGSDRGKLFRTGTLHAHASTRCFRSGILPGKSDTRLTTATTAINTCCLGSAACMQRPTHRCSGTIDPPVTQRASHASRQPWRVLCLIAGQLDHLHVEGVKASKQASGRPGFLHELRPGYNAIHEAQLLCLLLGGHHH